MQLTSSCEIRKFDLGASSNLTQLHRCFTWTRDPNATEPMPLSSRPSAPRIGHTLSNGNRSRPALSHVPHPEESFEARPGFHRTDGRSSDRDAAHR